MRFRIEEELRVATAYRQCRITTMPFAADFIARKGEEEVDRKSVVDALSAFLKANNLKTDWQSVENAPKPRNHSRRMSHLPRGRAPYVDRTARMNRVRAENGGPEGP